MHTHYILCVSTYLNGCKLVDTCMCGCAYMYVCVISAVKVSNIVLWACLLVNIVIAVMRIEELYNAFHFTSYRYAYVLFDTYSMTNVRRELKETVCYKAKGDHSFRSITCKIQVNCSLRRHASVRTNKCLHTCQ